MATKIRLKRLGGKHDPHFRIVVMDSRARRDGSAIEELGYYNPTNDPILLQVNRERALHWLAQGAQPTDTVRSLLRREGLLAEAAGAAPTGDDTQAEPEPEETGEASDADEDAVAVEEATE
ncbi:MAG: 30S ribosomal protein S16 [Armatimonadetes bacterium]|nr:30S ribosomal protein S16 [Armatimonadota bacterium]